MLTSVVGTPYTEPMQHTDNGVNGVDLRRGNFSMNSFTKIFLTFIFITANIHSSGQVNDQKIRRIVLDKGIIDSLFVFGKWTNKGGTETHLKYLGEDETKHGASFKIVTSSWIWGLTHRASSCILVYNNKNQYVGVYYVYSTTDLPIKMEVGKLIFENTKEECNEKLVTVINLIKGLPKRYFRKSCDKFGDMFYFKPE